MSKPAILKFLGDEFSSIGLMIQDSPTSNRMTVCDSNFTPIKEYYYKIRNSDNQGFWGPMKPIIDELIASNEECTLVLITDVKIYSLDKQDVKSIPANFKLNSNNQYLIFEEDLVNLINPYCYNL